MKRIVAIIMTILLVLCFASCSCGGDNYDSAARVETGGEWSKMY